MSKLNELYQEVIIDHSRSPRNFHKLPDANRMAEGSNPLCGDQVTVYLVMENDKIRDVGFLGAGCAISKASASMMTAAVKDKTRVEAEGLFDKFHRFLTGTQDGLDPTGLGKLAVFQGVSEFPIRVKCATLAWHTLREALEDKKGKVSTE